MAVGTIVNTGALGVDTVRNSGEVENTGAYVETVVNVL